MNSRRNFIKQSTIVGVGISMVPNLSFGLTNNINKEVLKIGLIGVGLRGTNHLNNVLLRKDVLVTAICDIDPIRITIALDHMATAGQKNQKYLIKTSMTTRIYLN